MSEQSQRIAQLEEQLKSALGTMKEVSKSSGGTQQDNWESWNSWASLWDTSEEPAYKMVKEEAQ